MVSSSQKTFELQESLTRENFKGGLNMLEHPAITRTMKYGYPEPERKVKTDRYGTPIEGEKVFIDWNRFEEIHAENLTEYLHDVYGLNIEEI